MSAYLHRCTYFKKTYSITPFWYNVRDVKSPLSGEKKVRALLTHPSDALPESDEALGELVRLGDGALDVGALDPEGVLADPEVVREGVEACARRLDFQRSGAGFLFGIRFRLYQSSVARPLSKMERKPNIGCTINENCSKYSID